MTPELLEEIRLKLGKTQEQMADLLQCGYVGYKRYVTHVRPVPRYIARSAEMIAFMHQNKLLVKFEKDVKDT